jgi:hypothetical protein
MLHPHYSFNGGHQAESLGLEAGKAWIDQHRYCQNTLIV